MGAFCRTKALGPSMLRVILALALLGCALAWQNSWDRPHNFQCSGGQYINRIRSYHHNHYEDRRWLAYCTRVSGIKADRSCAWTGWGNSWDGILSYTCPAGKVITGMYSQHDNGREDRLFKFKCCSVYSERKNCPNGKFGANCQFSCACKGNAVCNKVTGSCPRNECRAGRYGSNCQLSDNCYYNNKKNSYLGKVSRTQSGETCEKECHCQNGASCTPTGYCRNGCAYGWA